MSGPYRVELLDADGCELSVAEEGALKDAKRSAVEKTREPCYEDWRLGRVIDADGWVLWDKRKNEAERAGVADAQRAMGLDSSYGLPTGDA